MIYEWEYFLDLQASLVQIKNDWSMLLSDSKMRLTDKTFFDQTTLFSNKVINLFSFNWNKQCILLNIKTVSPSLAQSISNQVSILQPQLFKK